jgi:hypothetical protein
MLGPRGLARGGLVGFTPGPRGLQAQQQPHSVLRQARHPRGRTAGAFRIRAGRVRPPQAVEGLRIGSDELCRQRGLGRVGRAQPADLGNRGVVSPAFGARIATGRRQGVTQCQNEVVVRIAGQLAERIGRIDDVHATELVSLGTLFNVIFNNIDAVAKMPAHRPVAAIEVGIGTA